MNILIILVPIYSTGQGKNNYVFIDSVPGNLKKSAEDGISSASSFIFYLGAKMDTIQLSEKCNTPQYTLSGKKYDRPKKNELSIFVDTSQKIRGTPVAFRVNQNDSTTINYPMSYPIIIESLAGDTLNIGYGNRAPITIEAQNKDGVWKPINKKFIYMCGTGLRFPYILPNQILISNCTVFEGNFKTKMRVVYGDSDPVYSNSYIGYINIEQFSKGVR